MPRVAQPRGLGLATLGEWTLIGLPQSKQIASGCACKLFSWVDWVGDGFQWMRTKRKVRAGETARMEKSGGAILRRKAHPKKTMAKGWDSRTGQRNGEASASHNWNLSHSRRRGEGRVQNAYVESFHGKLRDECLNASWFENLWDARRKISTWRQEYNQVRPHSSLGYRTPEEFARGAAANGCGKDAASKPLEDGVSTSLGNPAENAGFPLSHSLGGEFSIPIEGQDKSEKIVS